MCASGQTWRDSLNKRILLDNGAYQIKFSSASETKPSLLYNAVGKDKKTRNVYIGNKLLDEFENGHSNIQVTYPIIRGLLQDSDIETVIWKQVFSKFKKLEERASCLAMTLPPVLPDIVSNRITEIVFEDFEFDALFLSSTHSMIREAAISEFQMEMEDSCQLVVDSGFSFTYIMPFFAGRPLKYAATRIDIGGKLITNLLNEVISFKEVNLQGETHLVNDVKEQLCYVSTQFQEDLDIVQQKANPICKEYVLPDYKQIKKGYVRDPQHIMTYEEAKAFHDEEQINTDSKKQQAMPSQQAIRIGNERFTIPEVLFNPSDIGVNEAGISESIEQAINKSPKAFERQLYKNVIVAGGNVMFKNFRQRVLNDLQSLKPDDSEVRVFEPQNPITSAWKGLKIFCSNKNNFEEHVVTRKEYQEEGYRIIKKFYL